jgi:hypothetical protein
MKILNIKECPNGDFLFEIDLTKSEKEMIKQAYGWKRLTQKRLREWFIETLKNTKEIANEK